MILRLVFSLFFFSLVTGNHRFADTELASRTVPCDNKICICQESKPPSPPPQRQEFPTLTSVTGIPPLVVEQSRYGYTQPVQTVISSEPNVIETKNYDVEYLSENEQGPLKLQNEEIQVEEKTICFTPSMVHRMIKAALEYVSQMPSDISNILDKMDDDLNRTPDMEAVDDEYDTQPMHPLDSKTIFQLVNKPKAETRTNLILKYELPTVQEPQCKDALDKLTEIAYNAYLQLKQHPQCRDYLYKFASSGPEERPRGHLDYGPEVKSLVASILDRAEKLKPEQNYPAPQLDLPIPQIHEMNVPQIHKVPLIHEIHSQKYEIPQSYDVPQRLDVPQTYEITKITKMPQHYEVPQNYEIQQNYERPQVHNIPQIQEIPHKQKITIPQIPQLPHSKHITQIQEFQIPQIQEINIPQIHEFDIPQISTMQETIQETISPKKPADTMNQLINDLYRQDVDDDLYDRFMNVVNKNKNNFHPKIYNILLTLSKVHNKNANPRLKDILLLLLKTEKNKHWPWNDKFTDLIVPNLLPDENGTLNPEIVDITLKMLEKPANEIEYILLCLKTLKKGTSVWIKDIIIKLIKAHLNNLLRLDQLDVLMKLVKPSLDELDTTQAQIADNLSRWNEMGVSPKHLDSMIKLLKLYVNGTLDRKIIDIIHYLLTTNNYVTTNHKDFILSFLYPENEILDTRRVEIIHFLLDYAAAHPRLITVLLSLLQKHGSKILTARFMDILLFLYRTGLLTADLLESVISLLSDETTGQLNDNKIKSFFFQLAPHNKMFPKLTSDVSTLLNQDGQFDHIIDWLKSANNDVGIPNRDASPPPKMNAFFDKDDNFNEKDLDEVRAPEDGYVTNDEFLTVFKWLDNKGLLNPEQGVSNKKVIEKLLKVFDLGDRESGVVELTYMLKHEKPLIYQPVYYVKYRLPILSFISNMKNLIVENPTLTADPMKLLQELIVISNVTEVSPNLQGYPKEEIVKLTVNDGDLVQAKILDQQNLNFNEQINYVHGLNQDISPEEILQLNRMNEAKYYPDNVKVKGTQPRISIQEISKLVGLPTRYQHTTLKKEGGTIVKRTIQNSNRSHFRQNLIHLTPTLHDSTQI